MKDMDKAVDRIELAIANEENILVYGDYDVEFKVADKDGKTKHIIRRLTASNASKTKEF